MSVNNSNSKDNFDTLWLQDSLNRIAIRRALEQIQRQGMCLPCTVQAVNVGGYEALVTVQFEVANAPWTLPPITIPKQESQWFRQPTQVGDVGITMSADTFIGSISGQGSGTADLTVDYGNLSSLIFVPIGVTTWPAPPDLNKVWANGPNGARLGDAANGFYVDCDATTKTLTIVAGQLTITASGSELTIAIGDNSWTFGSTGLTLSTGVVAETHVHGGVESGSSITTEPQAG